MIIEGRSLVKVYNPETVPVHALRGVDIALERGEMVAVIGPSGSGKSTLLHLLGLLDEPTEGKVLIEGRDATQLSKTEKTLMRLNRIGYVFQEYNLIPELTSLENVFLPAMMSGKEDHEGAALDVLDAVGLRHKAGHKPSELSGGEQQRVAIARALVNNPVILLADEPTANLDSAMGNEILNLFKKLNKSKGQTILIITHEPEHVKLVDRVINLRDGRMASQSVEETLVRCFMCETIIIRAGAIHKSVKGKELFFCCHKCAEEHEKGARHQGK